LYSPPAGHEIVLTKDALVAGEHFFSDDPADSVARKSLRVNLSDLAAKGADPAGFLLALAIPKDCAPVWLEEFAASLGDDVLTFRCPLFGGDTVRTSGPLTISITALGTVPTGAMVHRRGAQPGDRIFVSGTIGDAALGLRLRRGDPEAKQLGLDEAERRHLVDRYLYPQPRTALASALRNHASAAMDVSDGLVGDLAKLCRVSGVSAEIQAAAVPLSAAAEKAVEQNAALIQTVLTGGDDYEIVCTVPERNLAQWRAASRDSIRVTEIGRVIAGSGAPVWLDARGQEMAFARPSFSHL
jgi:thiamine-monophosphate kinase